MNMQPNISDRNTALSFQSDTALTYFSSFKANATRVMERYRELVALVARQNHATHEIESILDNFFVVEVAIFEIQNGLRKEDFKKLPLIAVLPEKYVPRLYFILSELVSKTDDVIDKKTLEEFLISYQEHSPLSIRELYAIPFMLQVVFVEHFGRLIDQAIQVLKEYKEADVLYASIKKEIDKTSSREFSKITSTLASKYPLIPLSFGLHLYQKLSQEGSAARPVIKWIKLNFEKQGMDIKNLGDIESKLRNRNSLLTSHIIESLHWLTQARWDDIVQGINVVDAILSRDPVGAYAGMDVETKSDYRRVIVRIAERAAVHEAEVAKTAVRLALASPTTNKNGKKNDFSSEAFNHVGYYLVDKGRIELEKKIGYQLSWRDHVYRFVLRNNELCYLGSVIGVNIAITTAVGVFLFGMALPVGLFVITLLLVFFLSLEITLNTANVIVTRFLPIKKLPQLDLLQSISEKQRTFVVIPSMFRSAASTKELVRKLEVRYLGNTQENIFFALLLDFRDAKTEKMPGDDALVATVLEEIAALNAKYSPHQQKFFVLYRKRMWNEKEDVYMCWERKRGKLREFNMLMRGATKTSYINEEVVAGFPHVSYVITLDEDTELPKDAASKLIGSIDHPLNRPELSANGDRVVRGYGIIQPRVSVRLETGSRSIFSKLFSAVSGIDSYSSAVSDVYQDLFNSGLFFGKGIYSIDAVEKTMDGKIPENLLLSHDLLEGVFARVGFASTVVLFDGFPNYYHEFMARLERWIRGDWQIVGWVMHKYHPHGAPKATTGFSHIDRWKIFDNLRRSLVPVVAVLLIAISLLSKLPLLQTSLFILIVFGAPFFVGLVNDIFSIKRIPLSNRIVETWDKILIACTHVFLRVVFLLHQAVISTTAILVTLVNLIRKKHLLRWVTSTDSSKKFRGKITEYYRVMWIIQAVPILLALFVYQNVIADQYLYYWCLLWVISPLVGFVISIPLARKQQLSGHHVNFLRSAAYRTTQYFLDFSGKENNWLIQDHFQESPKAVDAAHPTTSPTNIGMHFASFLSSYEFGFISLDKFIDRTRKAFVSLDKLERFKGHLYNWYDIERLTPLLPKYVSSVDSANFVMALITVKQGIDTLNDRPIFSPTIVRGLQDAVYTLMEEVERLNNSDFATRSTRKIIREIMSKAREAHLFTKTSKNPKTVSDAYTFLTTIHQKAGHIEKVTISLKTVTPADEANLVSLYTNRLISLIEEHLGFIRYILPHALTLDTSIHSHVFRDAHLLPVYHSFINHVQKIPALSVLSGKYRKQVEEIHFEKAIEASHLAVEAKKYVFSWYEQIMADIAKAESRASEFLADIDYCKQECNRFIDEPDFTFLYNKERGLFHIGYNAAFDKIDNACYNFLASESNSVSFVAILKNQVTSRHWFYLGRKLVKSGQDKALVSWGGSLFEYLTPLLFFQTHADSLLGKTAWAAIKTHMKDAHSQNTAWGMGESAYYAFDAAKHYQYQVFGSPKLGLKRGLADYLVISPYVTALALSIIPERAADNLKRLTNLGARGNYGFYDAVDYMNEERVRSSRPNPIRTYYAHHQGFTLLSLHNALLDGGVQKYFHNDPRVESLEILLEEKMPTTPARPLSTPVRLSPVKISGNADTGIESKQYIPLRTDFPRFAYISNGTYSVGVSNSGAGWSRYKGIALTRFRDDSVAEEFGSYLLIKDEKTGKISSPTIRPLGGNNRGQKVVFYENKAEFFSTTGNIISKLQITVDPKNPVEVRALTLTNKGDDREKMSVASFAEVSLALQSQDVQHPQYQKLHVASEFIEDSSALVYSRPHPEDRTKKIYFAHMLGRDVLKSTNAVPCVSREDFIGRYGSIARPNIFSKEQEVNVPLYTLDPVYSLRTSFELKPGESVQLSFVNIAHENKDELLKLIKNYRRSRVSHALIGHAEKESALATRNIGISQEMASLFQSLASLVLGGKSHIRTNTAPVSNLPYIHSLWRLGISGDYPILVIMIKDIEDLQMVKYALACRSYWKSKGIEIDTVILNQEPASYIKLLDDEIDFLVRQSRTVVTDDPKNRVYHVKSDLMTKEDRDVLLYVARVVIDAKDGALKKQIAGLLSPKNSKLPTKIPMTPKATVAQKRAKKISEGLLFENAWGGFDEKNSEYVMSISNDRMPPVAWSNIIANEQFGTVVTEAGAMNTWAIDSYDNRISAWQNDPLAFKSSEMVYIRDEETGEVWNPTPLPIATKEPFIVRHGKGYTTFEHAHAGIAQSFDIFVAQKENIKISVLKLKNTSKKKRAISITTYLEPVMGVSPNHTQEFLSFKRNEVTGALVFKHDFKNNLSERMVFVDLNGGKFTVCTDKNEFLGRYGTFEAPAALGRNALSNTFVQGSSPCVALQTAITLEVGEEKEIIMLVGESSITSEIERIVNAFRVSEYVALEKTKIKLFWSSLLSSVQIESPDKKLDMMFNEQLLYQNLSARVWGKTGAYQPSGAFGFRDQLQDMTSFIWADPQRVREFILKAAAHQFKEGDALNWWHDYNNFGSRNVLSDHQLWLTYATAEYLSATDDQSILEEVIPYLDGKNVNFTYQRTWTGTPTISEEKGTLYDHCLRALEKSSVLGSHGLPLMGMGDWNDGLSRVGVGGSGESVWVGWFLIHLIGRFLPIMEKRNDTVAMDRYRMLAADIERSIEKNAWDGKWYRRAFLDNGVALGSSKLKEFKIDSVSQSWAMLSGKGNPERVSKALQFAFSHLYDGTNMKLMTPALKSSIIDPGYIKDYPAGIRENGSQYNHAALFMAQALFLHREADDAKKILDLVNPIHRSSTTEAATVYRVEPYVVAGDIYAEPSYRGRGGWTWYSGSAGVMYKTILQYMFGFIKKGNQLSFKPSLPSEWKSCVMTYRFGTSEFRIEMEKPEGEHFNVHEVFLDGVLVTEKSITMIDDGVKHVVKVIIR